MRKYVRASWARANALLDLMEKDDIDAIAGWMPSMSVEQIEEVTDLSPRTERILDQTAAQDRLWRASKPLPDLYLEWLAARYWAIASATALSIAEELQDAPRWEHRPAVLRAAEVAHEWLDRPSLSELLWRRLPA